MVIVIVKACCFHCISLSIPGGEGQRVLHVRDAMQHHALQQGALFRQDPQQSLRQIPRQEIQQV